MKTQAQEKPAPKTQKVDWKTDTTEHIDETIQKITKTKARWISLKKNNGEAIIIPFML